VGQILRHFARAYDTIIASETKQSPEGEWDCFVASLLAMTVVDAGIPPRGLGNSE
jgi:hypothetical protein